MPGGYDNGICCDEFCGTYHRYVVGPSHTFLAKINPAASGDASLVYSTFLSAFGATRSSRLLVDGTGSVAVSGIADPQNTNVSTFVYIAKLGPNGSNLLYSSLLDASPSDSVAGVARDRGGNIYVAGQTFLAGFTTTPHALQVQYGGGGDAYLVRQTAFTRLDLNGDGKPDLIFQDQKTGQLAYWLMQGRSQVRMGMITPSNPGSGWQLAASADLNIDGSSSLIFQNSTSGDLYTWSMNGSTMKSGGYLRNGGGAPGLALGAAIVNPGAGWRIVAAGDLNGDGYPDLLFQNSSTGDLYAWLMMKDQFIEGTFISPKNPGANWKVVGLADLNRDGNADILFQNSQTGDLYAWFMLGTVQTSGRAISPANPGPDWHVAGVLDIDQDGQPDIVFQNGLTGQLAYWFMRDTTQTEVGLTTPSNPGSADWRLVGQK